MSDTKPTYFLFRRSDAIASGESCDLGHIDAEEVVVVDAAALDQVTRERDELRASATRGWEQADSLHLSVKEARDENARLREALKACFKELTRHADDCAVTTLGGECDCGHPMRPENYSPAAKMADAALKGGG